MTVLSKYQRLESTALWRATADAQRREVIVSLGDATLTISDKNDRALTHWSLPALVRLNPGDRPALYSPGADDIETLEIEDDEMTNAIEKVRRAIERSRPHPGRLRWAIRAGVLAGVAALSLFWLPGALVSYTVSVVPDATRTAIGNALMTRIERVAGRPCTLPQGRSALIRLRDRLELPGSLTVLRSGVRDTVHLPGGRILLNRALVEDFEEPDVVAGYLLAEDQRRRNHDPLERMLQVTGFDGALRLVTTGEVSEADLSAYAEYVLTATPEGLDLDALLLRFEDRGVRSAPYGYAVDVTGESTFQLIEADPFARALPREILSDADWVALQSICGG